MTQGRRAPDTFPLVLTILWLVGMPTLFVIGNAALPGILNLDRVLFLLVATLWGARAVRHRSTLQPLGRVEKTMAVFLLVAVLSWLRTVIGKDTVTLKQDADFLLRSFLMPFAAFLIGRDVHWTRARICACVGALLAGLGVYLIVVGGIQIAYDPDFLTVAAARHIHRDRAKGSFNNAIIYGMVVSMLLLLALFLSLQVRGRWRLAVLGISAALTEALVLSKGRALWFAAVAAMAFVGFRCRRIRVPAALVTAALIGQLLFPPSGTGLRARLTDPAPAYDRVAVYVTDLNMIAHKPLFGFGLGLKTFNRNKAAYYASCCNVSAKWAADCHVPHNELLNVLILMGAVGLLAYLAVVRAGWQLLSAAALHGGDPWRADLAVFVQAAFIVLAISAQLHDLLYVSYVLILFFFLMGIVAHHGAPSKA